MKTILLFSLLILGHLVHGQMGELRGTVNDGSGEVLPFVKVLVYKGNTNESELAAGMTTDFDGNFRIVPLQPGNYDIVITDYSFEMDTLRLSAVEIKVDHITNLGEIEMKMLVHHELDRIPIIPHPTREIEVDPFGRAIKIDPEDIRRP